MNVDEDGPPTVVNVWEAFEDAENADTSLSLGIAGNTNSALFASTTIDAATGQLVLTYAPDASGTAVLTVEAADPGGLVSQTNFTLTVTPVNNAPTTHSVSRFTVSEDSPARTFDIASAVFPTWTIPIPS